MSFCINGHNLPTVRTYVGARDVYERSKPQDSCFRALVRKRDTSKRVWMEGETVHFRYHYTDVVSWHSPTEITVRVYDSRSTVIFADSFTPSGVGMCAHANGYLVNGLSPERNQIRFSLVGSKWVANEEDLEQTYRLVVDRSIAFKVAKKVRPFLQWRAARAKLMGEKSWRLSSKYRDVMRPQVMHYLHEAIEHQDKFVEAAKIAHGACDEDIVRSLQVLSGAVRKEPMLRGVPAPKSVFDPYTALLV